nr:MAG TPA: apovitellenin I [Caudoviricetes sp.]
MVFFYFYKVHEIIEKMKSLWYSCGAFAHNRCACI